MGLLFLYVLLSVWLLCSLRYCRNGFYDAFDRIATNAVKGFFICIVFIRHAVGYIEASGYAYDCIGDRIFLAINRFSGQLIVVMFLFYSGFGVMASIHNKGMSYVRSMPRHRIMSTIVNFDIAVIVFGIVAYVLGDMISVAKLGLSLIGWSSVGNSNWYIFVIVLCYLATWISGEVAARWVKVGGGAWLNAIILCCIAFVLSLVKQEWWYNTMLAYPAGCLYAEYRNVIEKFIKRNYWAVLVVLGFSLMALVVVVAPSNGILYNALALVFALFIVTLSMKFMIDRRMLAWMGLNLFPLYIYQRIPMRILSSWNDGNCGVRVYVYFAACAAITLAIARVFPCFRVKV